VPISNAKSGLGKGLGALIPEDFDSSLLVDVGERVEKIALSKLVPNPDQPRTVFDDEALEGLAASIREHGIVQPLVASPVGNSYVIIAGERRWRAAGLAKLKTVPVIVRTSEELERLELALVENVQRVDLSALEQAVSIERLHQQFNLGYADIAKRLGKAMSTVSNIARLLQLPKDAKEALQNGTISEGHARQILSLKDSPERQAELLGLIIERSWSVREAERFVTSLKDGVNETKDATKRVATDTPETKRLSKRYGAPVLIRRTARGGRVEIGFTSDDELARILSELER
jgi:ParB family chromosome partitioning protein